MLAMEKEKVPPADKDPPENVSEAVIVVPLTTHELTEETESTPAQVKGLDGKTSSDGNWILKMSPVTIGVLELTVTV